MWSPTRFSTKMTWPISKPQVTSEKRSYSISTILMNPNTSASATIASEAKPKFAYAIATALGAGYMKPAPGTWGSLVGLVLAVLCHPFTWFVLTGSALRYGMGADIPLLSGWTGTILLLGPTLAIWLAIAWLGVRTSTQVANHVRGA